MCESNYKEDCEYLFTKDWSRGYEEEPSCRWADENLPPVVVELLGDHAGVIGVSLSLADCLNCEVFREEES